MDAGTEHDPRAAATAGRDERILGAARRYVAELAAGLAELPELMGDDIVEVSEALLGCEGHVIVSGSGTSSAVARRLAHLLTVVGVPAFFLASGDAVHGGSATVTDRDALIAISKGGASDELNVLATVARAAGAPVIAMTQLPDSPLARLANHVLCYRSPDALDPGGHIAVGSSVYAAVIGDALCSAIVDLAGVDESRLLAIHPGGAVGKLLAATLDDPA